MRFIRARFEGHNSQVREPEAVHLRCDAIIERMLTGLTSSFFVHGTFQFYSFVRFLARVGTRSTTLLRTAVLSVRLSVRVSVHHIRDPRLNYSSYRNASCSTRKSAVLSDQTSHFVRNGHKCVRRSRPRRITPVDEMIDCGLHSR